MVNRVWTLTERLAVGIALVLLTLSIILGITGYVALSNLFEHNLKERADSQARQLALFSADALLVYDYATLERYAEALSHEPGIISVSIIRNDGEILAQSGEQNTSASHSAIKVKQALKIGNTEIGFIALSVDRKGMESSLQYFALVGLFFLLAIIFVLFWVLRAFIERSLIRPVQQLAMAANPLVAKQCPEPKQLPQELERIAVTFRSLCRDIKTHFDERERAELKVRHATERLTREQRLATVGLVAAGLAHNLNTPLGSIKGYAQLLSERLENEDQKLQVSFIVEQAEACAKTVRNLLTAVRMPEVEKLEFDLYQHVVGAIELMRSLLKDQKTIIKEPEAIKNASCIAYGDPGAVEQILFNLLTNAAQAGASQITVQLYKQHNTAWILTVTDNGPGIKDALYSSLFDPFVTDKPAGEGTGLGLYMSQKLAAGMGAKLTLKAPQINMGASFELSFFEHSSRENKHS